MVKIVCWNINRSLDAYPKLQEMDADVALLQEVGPGAADEMKGALGGNEHWNDHPDWNKHHGWSAILKLSDRVKVRWFRPICLMATEEKRNQIAVSDLPTLAAACVTPLPQTENSIEPFIVVSMYARWYAPHPLADNKYEYSDASVHRIISDLTAFIGGWPKEPRIIAAGDLNTIYGATEESRLETPIRAQTVYDRMTAIGMEFAGPQWPHGGRRAAPTPYDDVPPDTCNVPTYYTNRQTPETAKNQLDYVFASRGFHERVSVRALNAPDEWGPSDHCRIVIEVG